MGHNPAIDHRQHLRQVPLEAISSCSRVFMSYPKASVVVTSTV